MHSGRLVDSVNRESITPRLYQGRIRWGEHHVCCSDGFAFDPMIAEKPVVIEDYCQMTFLGEVEMNILVSQENIREFVKK